jgi:hypothetical protein
MPNTDTKTPLRTGFLRPLIRWLPEAEQLYKQIISMDEKDASSNKKYNITGQAGDWMDLSRVYRHEHRYNEALDAIGKYKEVDELAAKVKFSDPKDETLLSWYSQNELAEIYREKSDLATERPFSSGQWR